MGHRNADMDAFGSALGIMTCANHVGRHAYIVIDGSNSMIDDALRRMEQETDVWGPVSRGDLSPVTEWLGRNIHQYGRLKKPKEILEKAMGGPLDASVYTRYLKDKFSRLYGL